MRRNENPVLFSYIQAIKIFQSSCKIWFCVVSFTSDYASSASIPTNVIDLAFYVLILRHTTDVYDPKANTCTRYVQKYNFYFYWARILSNTLCLCFELKKNSILNPLLQTKWFFRRFFTSNAGIFAVLLKKQWFPSHVHDAVSITHSFQRNLPCSIKCKRMYTNTYKNMRSYIINYIPWLKIYETWFWLIINNSIISKPNL